LKRLCGRANILVVPSGKIGTSVPRFYLIVFSLLALMCAMQFTSMLQENSTADEPIHLVAGYSYLRERAFAMNAEHPPLAKMLCALPLLVLRPNLPADFRSWESEEGELGGRFLYRNSVPADVMLNWARSVTIILTLLLGWTIAHWTRRRFGAIAALMALTLFCLDPNFIAHGRYVTTDLLAALAFFIACVRWMEYLERPSRRGLIITGVCFGIALLSKFSLLVLPVIFVVMSCWSENRSRRIVPLLHVGIIGAVIVFAAYGFEVVVPISDRFVSQFLNETPEQIRADPMVAPSMVWLIDSSTRVGSGVHWAARNVPVPAYSYFKGIFRLSNHWYTGHQAYLAGQHSRTGWWYYFPLAFAVKTPAAVLAMLLVAAGIAAARGNQLGLPWRVLLIPPAIYFLVSLTSTINIGIRHILPVYPFLFITIAVILTRSSLGHVASLVLVFLLAIESLSSHPNQLAFFNVLAGGSSNGPRWLSDSNIDWGQDLKKLKTYMDRNSIPSVCLHYFGSGDPSYYSVKRQDFSQYPAPANCMLAAASVTALHFEDSKLKPLLACEPKERIGYSIYLYELRNGECTKNDWPRVSANRR
jgi:predicted membrane-bound dolichyl-phosphate-mannose-protein mannosyltransferase